MLFVIITDFSKKQGFFRIIVRVKRQLVIDVFLCIDDVLGVAEPLSLPDSAILRNRAGKNVPRFSMYYIFTQFRAKVIDAYFNRQLSLFLEIYN